MRKKIPLFHDDTEGKNILIKGKPFSNTKKDVLTK